MIYKNESGQAVSGHPAPPGHPRKGDSFILERVDTGVLRKRSPASDGNPYLCGSGARAKWKTECNA
ncbi:hypothetical protein [Nonomuraea zeae]|uniref:hypothetical protein n=1 Tax=Nonomuraea zeae TaxID=1642303 RepID=UPI00110A6F77|nr:hypothetical protein [Nonomuraea zeae]